MLLILRSREEGLRRYAPCLAANRVDPVHRFDRLSVSCRFVNAAKLKPLLC